MTTIAWDGKTLAADRQINFGNTRDGTMTKIVQRKKDGALCSTTGNAAKGAAFERWFLKGGRGDYPGNLGEGDRTTFAYIIYSPEHIVHYSSDGWYEKKMGFFADGSGWELALGAMASGKTAKEAVEIASLFDIKTGSDIDTLEFPQ